MSFMLLPHETIVHILALAGPVTARRFKEVSRSFHMIVENSHFLQHIIILDLCGYVEPLVSCNKLSLANRVDILRAHSIRRANSGGIPPVQIRVQVPRTQGLGVNIKGYHEGVYAQFSRFTRILSLYRLPSLDYGIESKVWHHSSPAAALVVGLAIQTSLDLLVWLEASHPAPYEAQANTNQEYRYKIHLCSLTTGLPHPETGVSSIIDYRFTAPRTIAGHSIHLLGNLLAILFISVRERTPGYVVIWDWTTCLELARVAVPGSKNTSFAFLSEHLFVITRNSSFFEGGDHIVTGTFGQLDIYGFESIQNEPEPGVAHLVVRLSLPSIPRGLSGSSIQIREANSSATSSYICPSSKPKLYDLPPNKRILCLDVKAWPVRHVEGGPGPYGTLLIPVDILLEVAYPLYGLVLDSSTPHVSTPLLWPDWAHRTFWCDTGVVDIGIPHSAAGRMYAELDRNTGGIAVWDFRQPVSESNTLLHPIASGFSTTAVTPRRGTRTTIQLDEAHLPLTSVLLDNEYIIAQTRWEEDGYTLMVYHI